MLYRRQDKRTTGTGVRRRAAVAVWLTRQRYPISEAQRARALARWEDGCGQVNRKAFGRIKALDRNLDATP